LALQYAEIRDILKAFYFVKVALSLNAGHAESWNLLALLQSTRKDFTEALLTCKAALRECHDINLLITKAKLEQVLGNNNEALQTFKDIFSFYKEDLKGKEMEGNQESDKEEYESIETSILESVVETDSSMEHKIYTHTMSVISDGGQESEIYPEIMRVGRIDLWLSVADLYCGLKRYKEASLCIQEARNLSNLCADVYFQEGKLEEAQHKYKEAITHYKKALSIDPGHKESLVSLAVLYLQQQKYLVAEKYLTTVVRNDPTHHVAWYNLGKVLSAKGDSNKSSECLLIALELEETCPILSFSRIQRSLN